LTPPLRQQSSVQRFRQFEIVLLLVVLLSSIAAIQFAIGRTRLPYEIDYEEGNILNAGLELAHGGTPYPDPHVLPVLNAYTPLTYALVAYCVRQAGVQFALPRMVCMGCGIAIAFLIIALIWRWTRRLSVAIIFGALYLTLPIVQYWLPLLRVDLPSIALALGGMVLIAYRARWWPLATPFFVAAVYTKQPCVAAAAACFTWFLYERKWRTALGFALSLAAACALVFWVLQMRTGGLFAFHMLRDHPQPGSLRQWLEVIGKALPAPLSPFWHMAIFMLPLYAIVWLLLRRVVRPAVWRQFPLPVFYLAFAAAVSLITAPKSGSDTNHLLEVFAGALICAGIGYVHLTERAATRRSLIVLPVLLSTITIAIAFAWRSPKFNQGSTAMLQDCSNAYQYVRDHPGRRVLSENLGALVLANKPVLVSPYLLAQIVRYGGWSDVNLVSQVQNHQFDLILLAKEVEDFQRHGAEAWSPAVISAMEQNYELRRRFQCRYAMAAYEPK
jgi:hypothetical protein